MQSVTINGKIYKLGDKIVFYNTGLIKYRYGVITKLVYNLYLDTVDIHATFRDTMSEAIEAFENSGGSSIISSNHKDILNTLRHYSLKELVQNKMGVKQ